MLNVADDDDLWIVRQNYHSERVHLSWFLPDPAKECEAQERDATIRLKKLLDIRELLRAIDASPALRERVDQIIGKDVLSLGSVHGRA